MVGWYRAIDQHHRRISCHRQVFLHIPDSVSVASIVASASSIGAQRFCR